MVLRENMVFGRNMVFGESFCLRSFFNQQTNDDILEHWELLSSKVAKGLEQWDSMWIHNLLRAKQ